MRGALGSVIRSWISDRQKDHELLGLLIRSAFMEYYIILAAPADIIGQ
jgi:hypothetical protein